MSEPASKAGNGLQALAARLRHELNRFQLPDRERTLAKLILEMSWAEGMPAVRVENHETFYKLTGIAVTHISTVLTKLQRKRVVTVTQKEGETFYAINADAGNWQVTSRADWPDVLKAWNEVRELNGLSRLTEDQVNFKVCLPSNFFALKVTTLERVNGQFAEPITPFLQGATLTEAR